MNTVTHCAILVIIGYLSGSIPFGYLLARWMKGIDIRKEGSGNIGATNIGRVMGAKWGVAVLSLDALKGYLPVAFAPSMLLGHDDPIFTHCLVLTGVMTVIGHMFPVWLKFRGGKGVATSLGVVIGLAPIPALCAVGAYLVVLSFSRLPSLSSMMAVTTFAVAQLIIFGAELFAIENISLTIFALAVPLLVIVRHRSNITRILKGEEPKIQLDNSKNHETPSEK